MNPVLLYDGNCNFCTKLANSIQSSSNAKIQIINFRTLTSESLSEIHRELNLSLCEGEVQYIENGRRYPGFFAVRALSWKLKTYRYFAFVLYLPLVPFLGMFVMASLKRFRLFF
ncbi:DCC1-like thiol-disulfide oxidoreductase family protein [Leptospira sp. 96542]|nr:DCC1-like thiol-disulfide oxidoreductase family protein [Leptospira sp. 96542]